jgi:uncharacterized protein with GYD domain
MPTYIAFLKWTPQGLQNIKQSPSRLDAARKGFEAAGAKMKDFYMVTGRYDMVTSETVRAFTEDEYRRIVGGLA